MIHLTGVRGINFGGLYKENTEINPGSRSGIISLYLATKFRKGHGMTNSREKGARGERELADELTKRGMLSRRTVQYCGNSGDAADLRVDGTTLHVEVKRCERVKLREWVIQAQRDAHGRPWIVATRQNGGPWLIVQTLDAWVSDSIHAGHAIQHRQEVIDAALRAQAPGQAVPHQGQAPMRTAMDEPAE
jgi:Holliday junction resolvase